MLGKKPQIASDTYNIYDEELVDKLISGLGNLSSIYHKTQTEWIKEQKRYLKDDTDTPNEEVKTVKDEPAPKKKEKTAKVAVKESSDEES